MPLLNNNTLYEKEICVTETECDIHNRLKLSVILRQMQEISGEHLEAIGLPYEKLFKMGQVFLLSKLWLDIRRRPRSGERLRWQTAPLPPAAALFVRSNDLFDEQNQIVIHSDSLWILVDPSTRRILRPSAFCSPLPYVGTFSKQQMERFRVNRPSFLSDAGSYEVRYSDLDVNRHMNNAVYADIVCNYLPVEILEKKEPTGLFLHFQNEAVLHDHLSIKRAELETAGWYVAADKLDTKCFQSILKI